VDVAEHPEIAYFVAIKCKEGRAIPPDMAPDDKQSIGVSSGYRSNTDPVTAPEDKIVVHVLVPSK
jgi:hypothetical protein